MQGRWLFFLESYYCERSGMKNVTNNPVVGEVSLFDQYIWLKSYPDSVKWNQEIPQGPVYELLEEAGQKYTQKCALNFFGKKQTYGQLLALVHRAAKGLQLLGVKKGTKVGLFMPNCPYFVIMYYAVLRAGGTIVNYNPLYAEEEIIFQINNSETEVMVTLDLNLLASKLTPLVKKTTLEKIILCSIQDSLPFLKSFLFGLFKSKEKFTFTPNETIIPFSNLIKNEGDFLPVAINPAQDVAILQYTGGTTGVPKGAMLSHANVYANTHQAYLWFQETRTRNDKVLAALPLFHVFAMTAVMNLAIVNGSEMVMMFPRFSVEDAAKLIKKHQITFFPAVPTIFNMIINHPKAKKFDLQSLNLCLSGGAGLPKEVHAQFTGLSKCTLLEAYGLSETSPAVLSNPFSGKNKVGAVGLPFPGTYVKIVSLDDATQEMKSQEIGQIAVKGPQIMLGYWGRPEETQRVMVDDYFLTGDVGYMDDEGYVFLVDRLKDLIICSGFNVYPRMVEEAIYTHNAVEEVTVIGVPDPKRGETVKAFIKLKENMNVTEQDILDHLKNKISPIEIPKFIEFRDNLPKTLIGKLSKKELVEQERHKQKQAYS